MLVLVVEQSISSPTWALAPAVRAALAALVAFSLVLISGRLMIPWLRGRRVTDQVAKGDSRRLDALSVSKESTPTLGGLLLFGGVLGALVLVARPDRLEVWLFAGTILAFGLLGLADDLTKLRSGRKGILARHKLAWQLLIAAAVALCLYSFPPTIELGGLKPAWGGTSENTPLLLPFWRGVYVPLGVMFVPLALLAIAGMSNAVNLTDGLDGLAVGCSLLVAGAFLAVALITGDPALSERLSLAHVHGAAEIGVVLAALIGGGLGFLWFNCHPAQIFMGDTGALPLGACLGLAGVMLRQEVLLVMVAAVLVAEVLSVVLQVSSFKLWRRRIFLIAPLHHHFQFKGLRETRITVRFWIAGAICAFFSIVVLLY